MTTEKTIERLSLYRRLLTDLLARGEQTVFSHELASKTGVTSSQVRRDMMAIGCTGSPSRGYFIADLLENIAKILDAQTPQYAALVGIGNLGRAILAFFQGRRPKLIIRAAFDRDPGLADRIIHGCRCHPDSQLDAIIQKENIQIGIIAVPAREAQNVALKMVTAGIKGILNFAPIPLSLTSGIYVENIDLTMSLEKVAYFTRQNNVQGKESDQ